MTPGWSAVGGQTQSAYDKERKPGVGFGAVSCIFVSGHSEESPPVDILRERMMMMMMRGL